MKNGDGSQPFLDRATVFSPSGRFQSAQEALKWIRNEKRQFAGSDDGASNQVGKANTLAQKMNHHPRSRSRLNAYRGLQTFWQRIPVLQEVASRLRA